MAAAAVLPLPFWKTRRLWGRGCFLPVSMVSVQLENLTVFIARVSQAHFLMLRMLRWPNDVGRKQSWQRGQQTCPVNMWTVSSDVSIQRRHQQPPSVHLWAYCKNTQPMVWMMWCVRLATPPGSTSSTLFEQWCRFFYVPQEPDSVVRRDLRFFVVIREDEKF